MKPIRLAKTAIAVNAALFLSASMATSAFAAEEVKQATAADEIEVIEVTGIRGSLRENLNNKRFSNNIVDSINTEDIAKNPDKNMAEALQRIAGVQISRDFGEGAQVSIRGTASELTNTLINGQSAHSAQTLPNRDETNAFDFSSIPAAQVSKIEVYKSPQADIDAGGIGGTVILHTKKPLEMENGYNYFSIENEYNDGSKENSPQFTGMYNFVTEDSKFGASINLTYQERNLVRDGSEAIFGWFDYLEKDRHDMVVNRIKAGKGEIPYLYNRRSGTKNEAGGVNGLPGSARFEKNEKRQGIVAALQYAPTDELSLDFQYSLNHTDKDNQNHNLFMYAYKLERNLYNTKQSVGDTGFPDGYDPRLVLDPIADIILAAQINPLDLREINSRGTFYGDATNTLGMELQDRAGTDADQERFHFTADYSTETIAAVFQAGRITGKSFIKDTGTQFRLNTNSVNLDNEVFSYGYDVNSDVLSWSAGDWVTAPTDQMKVSNMFITNQNRENTEDFLQGDFEWTLDNDFYITSVKFGAKYQDVSKENSRFAQGSKRIQDVLVSDLYGGYISGIDTGGDNTPSSYFTVDKGLRDEIWNNGYLSGVEDYGRGDNCADAIALQANPDDFFGCKGEMSESYSQRYEQNQEILSYYAMANFAGERFRGNIGVRVVETDRDATQLVGAPVDTPENELIDGRYIEVSNKSSTRDVLPSFNLAYDLTDEVVLRTAASKVISHPSLKQLRTITNVNGNYNDDGILLSESSQRAGSAGNPELGSYTAVQYELGAEWYFDEASMVSITAFAKHISDIIHSFKGVVDLTGQGGDNQGRPLDGNYLVKTNFNTSSQDVEGFEFQLQHDFGNGFGGLVNYTFTDVPDEVYITQSYEPIIDESVPIDENGNGLVTGFDGTPTSETIVKAKDQSEHTFNASAYYENESFSARLSYNYRSEYFMGENSQSNRIREARSQVDLKMTYNITEALVANFSVINLTNESSNEYLIRPQLALPEEGLEQLAIDNGVTVAELTPYYTERKEKVALNKYNSGRRFYVGINYTF